METFDSISKELSRLQDTINEAKKQMGCLYEKRSELILRSLDQYRPGIFDRAREMGATISVDKIFGFVEIKTGGNEIYRITIKPKGEFEIKMPHTLLDSIEKINNHSERVRCLKWLLGVRMSPKTGSNDT